jgi:hypothetical protein
MNFITGPTNPIHINNIGRPEDYGAVGDGLTDDWIAIKNCILDHSVIEFDAKTYAVRGFIPLPSNTTIRGKGIDRTIIKIIDNSPYGYGNLTNNSVFSWFLLPDDPYWINQVNGIQIGSGSTDTTGYYSFSSISSSFGKPGRWCIGQNRPYEELLTLDLSNTGARQNISIEDLTIDCNFDNQAKFSTYNWDGNPSFSDNSKYDAKYAFKVRNNTSAISLRGQNITLKNIKVIKFGAGATYVDSQGNLSYNENFIVLITGGVPDVNENPQTNFLETTGSPYPITNQIKRKPNKSIGCIFSDPGDPDLQSNVSNQNLLSISGWYVRTIPNSLTWNNWVNDIELRSSIENCYVEKLYNRMPTTASIWNGNILDGLVSSSITANNLAGTYDGTIPGNGWATGSIGQFAIVWGGNGYDVYKKIKDGTPYGRWDLKRAYFEQFVIWGGAPIVRNCIISDVDYGLYSDSWRMSGLIQNNQFLDCVHPISFTIGPDGLIGSDYLSLIIENNYIQTIDRPWGMRTDGGNLTAISINSPASSSNSQFRGVKDLVIQNNTIKIPTTSRQYAQGKFTLLGASTFENGQLENFTGILNGGITGSLTFFDTASGQTLERSSYQGNFNGNVLNFTGTISKNTFYNGTSFFTNIKSYKQLQLLFPGTDLDSLNMSENLTQGITIPLDDNFKIKNCTIKGNCFINFSPRNYKGHKYFTSTENNFDIFLYSDPIMFVSPYTYYKETFTNCLGTQNYIKKISTFTIEHNYDDIGNLIPILIADPMFDQAYVIPNYSKDNLYLERSSILTPEVDNSVSITSNPHLYFLGSQDWTLFPTNDNTQYAEISPRNSYPKPAATFNVFQTGSISQSSSSFLNQIQPNTKYVIDYSLYNSFSPSPDIASFYLGNNRIYNFTNSIDNITGNHRIVFTSPSNPNGDFKFIFYKNSSISVVINKLSLYKYNNTASLSWNIKNHIINLDDDVNIQFIDCGNYTPLPTNTNFATGKNLTPINDEIVISIRQDQNKTFNVFWPSTIIWINGWTPGLLSQARMMVCRIKYSFGKYYGTIEEYQFPKIIAAQNIGVGQKYPTISDGNGIHITGKILRIDTPKTPSGSSKGNVGEICWDGSYIYICVSPSTWKRCSLNSY